jgi:ribose-phosphate pyrophosphokinase
VQQKVKIFSCSASNYLATQIANAYGQELGKVELQKFSDGEFTTSFVESVRGCDVFIIQSTPPPADNLFELLLMIDAAKRASARKNCCSNALFWLCSTRQKRSSLELPLEPSW